MSVSKENKLKAEAEAQAIMDNAIREREALYQKYKAEGHSGLDGHNAEYKAIMQRALNEIAEVKKKYGI